MHFRASVQLGQGHNLHFELVGQVVAGIRQRLDGVDDRQTELHGKVVIATETFHLAFLGATSKFKDMPQVYNSNKGV